MATAVTTNSNGHRSVAPPPPGRAPAPPARPGGRRRQLPLVAVGVVLVLGCALAFADASLRLGARQQVLVLTRAVGAGQVITGADLRAVRLAAGPGLAVIPAAAEGSVLGRPAGLALAAGTLLTATEVGSGSGLPAGSDIVAVGLKPGAYPPGLVAGDRVQVIPVTAGGGAGPAGVGSPIAAVVLGVQSASLAAGTPAVFSLQVDAADAPEVASLAAAGQASVIQVGG